MPASYYEANWKNSSSYRRRQNMSNHVTEWLNVYFDGELTGKRLFQVEEHLAECEACQVELESLEKLSGLLHKAPVPEFTSSERFAAQISLRIPHKQVKV